jgi:hypothetical protein
MVPLVFVCCLMLDSVHLLLVKAQNSQPTGEKLSKKVL